LVRAAHACGPLFPAKGRSVVLMVALMFLNCS
jgi:hypothetical protein